MRRRQFIVGLGSTAAWTLVARAQQQAMPVVGFLDWGSLQGSAGSLLEFRLGLGETGYVEGQNVAIEYRGANRQPARLPALALELVRRKVDVIVAANFTFPVDAARAATSTIPIVFMYGGDPVQHGFVASLNKPGGNVTGAVIIRGELGGKRLSLLRNVVPQATTVALLLSHRNKDQTTEMLEATRALGLQLIVQETGFNSDYEGAFATLAERKVRALIVGAMAFRDINKLVALSARYRIPTIYPNPDYVVAGGLMSYGGSRRDVWRQVGNYTGRILKGAQPANLPVIRSTKFDLIINLKTAKALGLTIPETLLAIADELIQ
jgi:putative ABC transport system substrate-binding protein